MTALDLWADDTWLSLIQGAIGSIVALAGAVFVVLLTIRHEKRKDRRREVLDEADRASERTARAIADIATAAAYVVRDVRHAPFFRITATTDLLAATLRFVLVVNADHPVVATGLWHRISCSTVRWPSTEADGSFLWEPGADKRRGAALLASWEDNSCLGTQARSMMSGSQLT